jgi:hypothetical protein
MVQNEKSSFQKRFLLKKEFCSRKTKKRKKEKGSLLLLVERKTTLIHHFQENSFPTLEWKRKIFHFSLFLLFPEPRDEEKFRAIVTP